MERSIDSDALALLLTARERDALSVALLPRAVRGDVDRACGTSKQARYNARKRAAAKLAQAAQDPG